MPRQNFGGFSLAAKWCVPTIAGFRQTPMPRKVRFASHRYFGIRLLLVFQGRSARPPDGRLAVMVLQSARNGGFIGAQDNARPESCDSTRYMGIGGPLEWRLIANHERGVASPNRNESPSHTLISAREEYGRQEREGGGSATVLSDLAPGRGTTISIEIPVPQNSHEK